jgi:NAD(P)-dependent dehydrogenase (short-subunit alcohol dehydrogenase family)
MTQVAVITGAASGFGFELSKSLHSKGWIVYGADKNKTALKTLESLGIKTLVMDVTSDTQVKNGINKVIKTENRIDLVVANAGYGGFAGIEDLSHDAVRQMFEVNVFGVDRTIRAALPQMRKQRSGRIIITASVVAHVSLVGLGWYAATKHAVEAMANALRQEVKPLGIKVSVIEPGTVKTGFGKVAFDHLNEYRGIKDYEQVIRGFDKYLGGMYRMSPGPAKVLRAMEKAAISKHPRPIYPASWDVRALKFVFYVLPRSWVDAFVLWLARH